MIRFRKNVLKTVVVIALLTGLAAGCSKAPVKENDASVETEEAVSTEENASVSTEAPEAVIADGTYETDFSTDSSMFHVNEACDGKGTLTVKDGEMTIHIALPSKNIVNLFPGTAEDAQKEGAVLLEPTVEEVTYSDGTTEEVNAFDVPVPVLDEEFDLALIGTKGKWYDHKVVVASPDSAAGESAAFDLADGEYHIAVTLEGGSGRASVESPVKVVVKDGVSTATIVWSSPNYDYMIVDGQKYEPVNTEGNSTFEIPVTLDTPNSVIADTTAMSKPYEIEYVLTFDVSTADSDATEQSEAMNGELELKYADQFSVNRYEDGYIHVHIEDGTDYVIIPEGAKDTDLGIKDAVIIHKPLKNIYLAASSAMDFFVTLDDLKSIGSCSTSSEDYSIEEAKKAIESGKIQYVGKYSSPDYEKILSSDCSLAIESTMITHSPEIKEELERLGIPVLMERSSYEKSPMGRLEWIKLYGMLLGKEDEADAFFEKQEQKLDEVEKFLSKNERSDNEKPKVVYFYVSPNGYVNVRKPGDYISTMIEMAGGKYCLSELKVDKENALSTMNINWEEFYANASDADIILYNSTIDGGIDNVGDLIKKNSLFEDFKAVKNGKVYCTNADMFQKSSSIVDVIVDLFRVINEKDLDKLDFIKQLSN